MQVVLLPLAYSRFVLPEGGVRLVANGEGFECNLKSGNCLISEIIRSKMKKADEMPF